MARACAATGGAERFEGEMIEQMHVDVPPERNALRLAIGHALALGRLAPATDSLRSEVDIVCSIAERTPSRWSRTSLAISDVRAAIMPQPISTPAHDRPGAAPTTRPA